MYNLCPNFNILFPKINNFAILGNRASFAQNRSSGAQKISLSKQVLGDAKALALETGPRRRRSSRSRNRSSAKACGSFDPRDFCSHYARDQDGANPKSRSTHHLLVPPNEMDKLFSPPKFRRSPKGSEDLFARRRKEFRHSTCSYAGRRGFSLLHRNKNYELASGTIVAVDAERAAMCFDQ